MDNPFRPLIFGWIDSDDLYLDRDASHRAAQAMAVDGTGIEVSPFTLDTVGSVKPDSRVISAHLHHFLDVGTVA